MLRRMAVIDDILSFVQHGADADDLLEGTVSLDSPELYQAALAEFDSWDSALANALIYLHGQASGANRRAASSAGPNEADSPRPERVVGREAENFLHVLTRSGLVANLELSELVPTSAPQFGEFLRGPGGEHRLDLLVPGVDDYALVLVTNEGNGVALDSRLLPHWDDEAVMRALHHRFGSIGPDEAVAGVIPRRLLRDAQRFYSVSIYGQIKATESREYSRLSSDAITAVLIKDGDALQTVFGGESRTKVFVGSSAGKAIVFDTKDIRSQGRKATGVKAIGLDPDARVIGAFDTAEQEWVGLVTDRGLCKRMRLADFRPQGRGGNGLQSSRLNGGDHVASMAALPLDGDTIIVTDRGRVTRFPAYEIPYGARASKGEPILDLADDEVVVQMIGVPAGEIAED